MSNKLSVVLNGLLLGVVWKNMDGDWCGESYLTGISWCGFKSSDHGVDIICEEYYNWCNGTLN